MGMAQDKTPGVRPEGLLLSSDRDPALAADSRLELGANGSRRPEAGRRGDWRRTGPCANIFVPPAQPPGVVCD